MLEVLTARIAFGNEAGLAAATAAFNRGFADYKHATRFSSDQMRRFLERSGCALENCAVLLANERGVWRGAGLAILATMGDRSWCGGLAVASDLVNRQFALLCICRRGVGCAFSPGVMVHSALANLIQPIEERL